MRRGHISVTNRAVAIATGTPINRAITEVTIVPTTSGSPWKMSFDASQLLPKMKSIPYLLIEAWD